MQGRDQGRSGVALAEVQGRADERGGDGVQQLVRDAGQQRDLAIRVGILEEPVGDLGVVSVGVRRELFGDVLQEVRVGVLAEVACIQVQGPDVGVVEDADPGAVEVGFELAVDEVGPVQVMDGGGDVGVVVDQDGDRGWRSGFEVRSV